MKKNPFEREEQLKHQLDQYKVDVSNVEWERSRKSRWIHYLASPTNNPLDLLMETMRGWTLTKVIPAVLSMCLAILQVIFL
ncbi:hypothetical protein VKA52_15515 [Halobacillus sp. HZG1]|uniref:hypothetical protein n=1 Tax=Halobacillus sp. HZG1 TaxID=3111769 RepID=UPI002DBA9422|nr:hypothetical protein [Halobacillus sp. HZG1]MEC3885141.1 hypothetical protein [Halobacillus sp. HZG1]